MSFDCPSLPPDRRSTDLAPRGDGIIHRSINQLPCFQSQSQSINQTIALHPRTSDTLTKNPSADDLLVEEDPTVLKALARLPPRESYDRIYRIRRATQLSLQQKILPKEEWTKPEEDVRYLTPILEQLMAEAKEKDALDTLTVMKKH